MTTPAWQPAVDGQDAVAAQINQFLGLHHVDFCFQGLQQAGNVVLPMGLTPTVVRVTLNIVAAGAGADVTVTLQHDTAGSPSGTPLVSVILPAEFAGSVRNISIPLFASGLTPGDTYWIVVSSGGDVTNHMTFNASGAVTPHAKTSTDGITWSATATQLMFQVFMLQTGYIYNTYEDAGARWVEYVYTDNQITTVNEYTGSMRTVHNVTYVGFVPVTITP